MSPPSGIPNAWRLPRHSETPATQDMLEVVGPMNRPLILKRAPIGDNEEDYDVLENGVVVGRIFHLQAAAPEGRPWMWASGHNARYEAEHPGLPLLFN